LEPWTAVHERHCGHAAWMRHYLCPCTKTALGRRCLAARTRAYNSVLENIAEEYAQVYVKAPTRSESHLKLHRRPKYNDFAVILGKSATEMNLMEDVPIEFVSPFDCFHPSLLGHQSLAVALWNDLFRPFSQKHTHFHYPLHIYCPSDEDTIRVD